MLGLALFFLLVTSPAFAQLSPNSLTTCQQIGSQVLCQPSAQPGNATTVTPLGNGLYQWMNSRGQGGTILDTTIPQPRAYQPNPQPYSAPCFSNQRAMGRC